MVSVENAKTFSAAVENARMTGSFRSIVSFWPPFVTYPELIGG